MLWSAIGSYWGPRGRPRKQAYLYEEIEELSHALVRPVVEGAEEGGQESEPTCMKRLRNSAMLWSAL